MNILYKPNPFIEGVLKTNKVTDLSVFNKILCNLQKTSKSEIHESIVTLDEFKEIITDNTINNPKGIFFYLTNTFQNEIIRWKEATSWKSIGLISTLEYKEEDEYFIIGIHDDILRLSLYYKRENKRKNILEPKIGITPLNLDLLQTHRNFYAHRLYEIFRQWGSVGKIKISVIELKRRLYLEDNYKVYYDFKKRVLLPSITKIKEHFNMEVELTEIKKGRKISEIIFYIKDHEPRHYNFNNNKENIVTVCEKDIVEVTNKTSLAQGTMDKLIKEYGPDLVSEGLKIMDENSKKKPIGAPKEYLKQILENKKEAAIRQDIISSVNSNKAKVSNFSNFTQRQYNYNKLEKQLLGWDMDDEDDEDEDENNNKELSSVMLKLKELAESKDNK